MRTTVKAVMVAVITAGVLIPGGTAQADAGRGAGYVWAGSPTTASYTPPANYQMNSTGTSVRNTVTRSGTGAYTVRFPGLGVTGGVAHATAYGAGTNQCKVSGWGRSGDDQIVNVRCHTLAGTPADSRFTASYTNRTSWRGFEYGETYPGGYVWANNPTAANYTPSTTYQYNSSGATNTVSRLHRGTYKVFLPGIGHDVVGGYPLVTAYGYGSERCKVINHGWTSPSTTIQVNVRCFDVTGDPVDTRFALTFTDRTNVLGLDGCCNPNGHQSAYALAHDPDAASYPPAGTYLHVTQGGTSTATRQGVGDYTMKFTNVDLGTGSVHVQAVGWDGEFCKVGYWNSGGIKVRCYDSGGSPVDTQYELTFTGPWLLG